MHSPSLLLETTNLFFCNILAGNRFSKKENKQTIRKMMTMMMMMMTKQEKEEEETKARTKKKNKTDKLKPFESRKESQENIFLVQWNWFKLKSVQHRRPSEMKKTQWKQREYSLFYFRSVLRILYGSLTVTLSLPNIHTETQTHPPTNTEAGGSLFFFLSLGLAFTI